MADDGDELLHLFGAPPRVDNAIALISPSMQGLRVQALLARGASGGAAPAPETANNQNLPLALEYERGALYLGATHERTKATSPTLRLPRSRPRPAVPSPAQPSRVIPLSSSSGQPCASVWSPSMLCVYDSAKTENATRCAE